MSNEHANENGGANVQNAGGIAQQDVPAYRPPDIDIHAGYEPPNRVAPKDSSKKMNIIIILLICVLALQAVSFASTFLMRNTMRTGNFPAMMQGGNAPTFDQDGNAQSGRAPNFENDGSAQGGTPGQNQQGGQAQSGA